MAEGRRQSRSAARPIAAGSSESLYSVEDLVAGAAGFGVKPEVVAGALRMGGVSGPISRSDCAELIARFLVMEV
jgi:hypothetical protein